MSYIEELWETFQEQPINILCTSFLIWAILPIILFGIWGIIQVAFYSSPDFEIFTNLFSNAILPWWALIIINFGKFILGYLILSIITLILVHHEIIDPINFEDLIKRLKKL